MKLVTALLALLGTVTRPPQEKPQEKKPGYTDTPYLPGGKWILNDTYPQGEERLQTPHLYHIATGRRVDLGKFHLPRVYTGEWRVDTHPRYSPDGRFVCIDAPVQGSGRQLHLIDIQSIVHG